MQFFWSALKLIIPLSSCDFFKEKMLYFTLYFFQKDIWLEKTVSDNPRKILTSDHQQMQVGLLIVKNQQKRTNSYFTFGYFFSP